MLILLVGILSGCGTKFIYHNIDWFIIDYLEDYITLTDEQEEFVTERIERLSEWHQQQELSNYVEHFDQLLAMDAKSLTHDQLEQHRDWIYLHYQRLLDQILPDVYQLASDLSDTQVEEFLDAVAKRHQEYADKYGELTEQQAHERYQQRITERMEEWLGELTEEQQKLVKQWAHALQITTNDWIAYQSVLRSRMTTLLAHRHNKVQFNSQLKRLLLEPENDYSQVMAAKLNYNQQTSNRYILEVVHLSTDKQLAHFKQTVIKWRSIARDLHQDYRQEAFRG